MKIEREREGECRERLSYLGSACIERIRYESSLRSDQGTLGGARAPGEFPRDSLCAALQLSDRSNFVSEELYQ